MIIKEESIAKFVSDNLKPCKNSELVVSVYNDDSSGRDTHLTDKMLLSVHRERSSQEFTFSLTETTSITRKEMPLELTYTREKYDDVHDMLVLKK